MGGCQSKHQVVEVADPASVPGPEESATTQPPRSVLSSLSPSVTLQTLLHRPNLTDLTKVGAKVANEGAHHLRNIFAKPLDFSRKPSLPVHPKSEQEKEWLEDALRQNFVFENLPHAQLFPLVLAFEEVSMPSGATIIAQGEPGDYFYVLREGTVEFATLTAAGPVGQAHEGDSFGELALLYDAPRAATVTALTDCRLYRVGQFVFRQALQSLAQENADEKINLLNQVPFLKDLAESERMKLASVMTPKPFHKDELLIEKGTSPDVFWIIHKGTVSVTDIGTGTVHYEDVTIGPGQTMGEATLATNRPQYCNATALEDGMAFVIDKSTFETVLGDFQGLILRSMDRKKLVCVVVACVFLIAISLVPPHLSRFYGTSGGHQNFPANTTRPSNLGIAVQFYCGPSLQEGQNNRQRGARSGGSALPHPQGSVTVGLVRARRTDVRGSKRVLWRRPTDGRRGPRPQRTIRPDHYHGKVYSASAGRRGGRSLDSGRVSQVFGHDELRPSARVCPGQLGAA